MNSIKSKQRVADHGEVFTPAWMVEVIQMNQAVFAFRRYEDASLRYTGIDSHPGLTPLRAVRHRGGEGVMRCWPMLLPSKEWLMGTSINPAISHRKSCQKTSMVV